MQDLAHEINVAGARLAREAADAVEPRRRRTSRASSPARSARPTAPPRISPDVNDPGFRNVSFDELAAAYSRGGEGLLDGGADLLLVETIFDTLNAKAALFAIDELFDELGERLPVMVSGTITDQTGRTLSGQTAEAFWNSVSPCPAARRRAQLRAGRQGAAALRRGAVARGRHAMSAAYPNAGLPNEFGGYDETPENMAAHVGEFAESGLLNIVGGCCGTTPEHIRAIADAVAGLNRGAVPEAAERLRLSGLEARAGVMTGTGIFVNVGERTNVTGSAKFAG